MIALEEDERQFRFAAFDDSSKMTLQSDQCECALTEDGLMAEFLCGIGTAFTVLVNHCRGMELNSTNPLQQARVPSS